MAQKDKSRQQEAETAEANIAPRNIEDEMKTSYIDYAMSVIVGRALSDVRDGLKTHSQTHTLYYEGNGNEARHGLQKIGESGRRRHG